MTLFICECLSIFMIELHTNAKYLSGMIIWNVFRYILKLIIYTLLLLSQDRNNILCGVLLELKGIILLYSKTPRAASIIYAKCFHEPIPNMGRHRYLKMWLKLYCMYLYTRPYMINRIWSLKQLWLQANGHAWFHLHGLRWPVRNGEGAKNSKWKYMSPAGFEPTPRQSMTGKSAP